MLAAIAPNAFVASLLVPIFFTFIILFAGTPPFPTRSANANLALVHQVFLFLPPHCHTSVSSMCHFAHFYPDIEIQGDRGCFP